MLDRGDHHLGHLFLVVRNATRTRAFLHDDQHRVGADVSRNRTPLGSRLQPYGTDDATLTLGSVTGSNIMFNPPVKFVGALLLAGTFSCEGDDRGPQTDAVDGATDSATTQDATSHEVVLLGSCQPAEGDAVDARVVFEAEYRCAPPSTPEAKVLNDLATWTPVRDNLVECTDPNVSPPSEITFENEYLVVLGVNAYQTCGFHMNDISVLDASIGLYVEATFTDESAGCEVACTMGGAYVVAIAIPRAAGDQPTLCRKVLPGCP